MRDWQSQAHAKYYCRYHIVFAPKYRKKAIFGMLQREIGAIFRDLCHQTGVDLIEGYAMRDHIHMLLMMPPKFSVANTVGFLKGKSAIRIFGDYLQVKRNFTGRHFWARSYCVSTVGLDEQMIREYNKNQETEERRQEQMRLAACDIVPAGGFHYTTRSAGGS